VPVTNQQIIAVFGASQSSPGDESYESGVECGRLLAEAGFAVVTGGYGGLMEAVSRGAHAVGGHVVGATAPSVFPGRAGANDFVSEEWPANDLVDRIGRMTNSSAGSIALPGSLGTMTELLVAWNLAFVTHFSEEQPKPVVTVGHTWRTLVEQLGTTLDTDLSIIESVDDVAAAVDTITQRIR